MVRILKYSLLLLFSSFIHCAILSHIISPPLHSLSSLFPFLSGKDSFHSHNTTLITRRGEGGGGAKKEGGIGYVHNKRMRKEQSKNAEVCPQPKLIEEGKGRRKGRGNGRRRKGKKGRRKRKRESVGWREMRRKEGKRDEERGRENGKGRVSANSFPSSSSLLLLFFFAFSSFPSKYFLRN